jgi:hypothetical protein
MLQVLPDVTDYEGMPKQFQLGPLVSDESVQKEIDSYLLEETFTADVMCDQQTAKIILSPQEVQLQYLETDITINNPGFIIKRESSNEFEVKDDKNDVFHLRAINNIQRDIVLGVAKGFAEERHLFLKEEREK